MQWEQRQNQMKKENGSTYSEVNMRIDENGPGYTTLQQRQADCTMLSVDRGFPIDVIFYSSVWEKGKKKQTKRTKQ